MSGYGRRSPDPKLATCVMSLKLRVEDRDWLRLMSSETKASSSTLVREALLRLRADVEAGGELFRFDSALPLGSPRP